MKRHCYHAAVVLFLATIPAVADEPETFAWGTSNSQSLGRYVLHVDRWPTDGKFLVPKSIPQIVAANIAGDGGSQSIDIGFNNDASEITLLLPVGDSIPASRDVRLQTCDTTQQFADGRIVFCAREAKVVGERAKLEEHPGNYRIGYWTNESDYVTWDYKATRWGKYDVQLVYSTASPDGTEVEIQIGGAKVSGALKSTGTWYRYTTVDLGDVYVNEGEQTLTVKCLKKTGGAVINLKAVMLTPTCEGKTPAQADDGVVTLHSRDATVHGTVLRYEPAEKKQTLGYWVKADDGASWNFTLNTPGVYDVEVLQGCGSGQGGSTMAVTAGDGESLEFVVEDTGHFQNFKPRIVGQVNFDDAGEQTLSVQPKTIAKAAACDIRQIRLLPVRKQ
jgi:hypothetical protein